MATFEILEEQNTRFVRAVLSDETIRAEAGALAYMRGAVKMRARVPGPITLVRSSLSDEAAIRPTFTGTGEVVLEASTGGYHILEVREKPWYLERGAYWASEDSVSLEVHRESAWTSFWGGDGLIEFTTKVSGHGQVVLAASGPVEEVELGEEELATEARIVIARSSRVKLSIRRPSRSRLSSWLSGERLLRVYRGPGRVLISSTPYWAELLMRSVRR